MKRQGLLAINAIVVFLCLIGLWQAVVGLNHLPPYILPGQNSWHWRCMIDICRS